MIVENLRELTGSSRGLHDAIDYSRDTYRSATTNPINREYAMGRHRPVADHERKKLLGSMSIGNVRENLIGRCLDQIVSRVQFDRFQVPDTDVDKFLDMQVVKKNHLKKAIASVITRVQVDGSAAMSMSWRDKDGDPENGRPILHHEQWWDGDSGMYVAISDTGEVLWAVSEWYDEDNNKFRTVYLEDVIIRYVKEGEGWRPFLETPWVGLNGDPLGVAVVYFSNGSAPFGPYSESTVGEVVDVQDALNASLFNRQAVSAMTGSMIYWATGVQSADEIDVGPGKFWHSGNDAAKFGSIQPGSMDSLMTESEDLRNIISGAFPVPTYRLGFGQWPSGTALIRADTPMIKRAKQLIEINAPSIVEIAHRCTEMSNAMGATELDTEAPIEAVFEPIDEIDPGTKVEIDQSTIDLYASLAELPEPLIEKMDLLSDDEIKALKNWKREQEQRSVVAQANMGDDNSEEDFG